MYQPKKYKKDHSAFLHDFIESHPFAVMVLAGERLLATHIPILWENNNKGGRLFAHIANHNEMHQWLKNDSEVLLIFSGADAYVSSSWYSEVDIPTWDYEAVHVNAKVELQTDEELQQCLELLIHTMEKSQSCPVAYEKIPRQIWKENFKEITGFWLTPIHLCGISKLHQGFSDQDLAAVQSHLSQSDVCGHREIGRRMGEERKNL